jgi:hypothetical protein
MLSERLARAPPPPSLRRDGQPGSGAGRRRHVATRIDQKSFKLARRRWQSIAPSAQGRGETASFKPDILHWHLPYGMVNGSVAE